MLSIATWLVVAVSIFGCEGDGARGLSDVEPYEIVELVPGVYAAIANPGGSAGSNAGIMNMGETAFVYDSGLTPEAGRQLKAVAEEVSGRNVTFVINSHYHDNHIGGNQAFDVATYLSTTATQTAVREAGSDRSRQIVKEARVSLKQIEEEMFAATDAKTRRELTIRAGDLRGILRSNSEFERIAPTVVWDRGIFFTGSLRQIKLVPTGVGHADGDVALWLAADSVLFTSDLVTTDRHPTMQDGNFDGWKMALDSLLRLDFNVVVPGHGPVGDRQSVLNMQEYLASLERAADEALAGTDIDAIPVDSAFKEWMFESQFRDNVRFVMAQRQATQ